MSLGILINYIGTFLYIAIFARVLLSWFPQVSTTNPLVQLVFTVTEPILSPIRRLLPRMGMFDLSPMIALILVGVIQSVLLKALA
ncbi:MAG: YggT family protein [Chloroflexota bacterium]